MIILLVKIIILASLFICQCVCLSVCMFVCFCSCPQLIETICYLIKCFIRSVISTSCSCRGWNVHTVLHFLMLWINYQRFMDMFVNWLIFHDLHDYFTDFGPIIWLFTSLHWNTIKHEYSVELLWWTVYNIDVWQLYINCLIQDCIDPSALAMELLQSCTKPSVWNRPYHDWWHILLYELVCIHCLAVWLGN